MAKRRKLSTTERWYDSVSNTLRSKLLNHSFTLSFVSLGNMVKLQPVTTVNVCL